MKCITLYICTYISYIIINARLDVKQGFGLANVILYGGVNVDLINKDKQLARNVVIP